MKRDWNPKQWSLYNLFEVIKCLLIVPFPQSSLNEEAGKMFMENYDEYFKVAKMLTEIHAKKKVIKKEPKEEDKNIGEKKEKEKDEDIEMKNASAKKEKIDEENKEKKIEIDCEEITEDKNNTKNDLNNSFIKDNLNRDNNTSLFSNDNNKSNNNQIINFDNINIFENFNIERSKTIKLRERTKFSILQLNSKGDSSTSQLFQSNNNQFSRMSSISSITSNITNISNYEIQKVSTFKEKPKLGALPLMSSKSLKSKNENNPYGFFRSKTINFSKNIETKKNNKDEINKWLMRI